MNQNLYLLQISFYLKKAIVNIPQIYIIQVPFSMNCVVKTYPLPRTNQPASFTCRMSTKLIDICWVWLSIKVNPSNEFFLLANTGNYRPIGNYVIWHTYYSKVKWLLIYLFFFCYTYTFNSGKALSLFACVNPYDIYIIILPSISIVYGLCFLFRIYKENSLYFSCNTILKLFKTFFHNSLIR